MECSGSREGKLVVGPEVGWGGDEGLLLLLLFGRECIFGGVGHWVFVQCGVRSFTSGFGFKVWLMCCLLVLLGKC